MFFTRVSLRKESWIFPEVISDVIVSLLIRGWWRWDILLCSFSILKLILKAMHFLLLKISNNSEVFAKEFHHPEILAC